jgi:hypothetical protein
MIKLEENRELLDAFRLGEMRAMEDVHSSVDSKKRELWFK